jgi:ParB family chromosome partitioning protein
MSSPGHIELERSIDSIRTGSRHRADLGDIDALADSIARQGLLQPITVTPEGVLVCGARRLAALRLLGVRRINVWVRAGVSDRLTQLLAEQDENALHKPLTPTESADLYREFKVLLAEDAKRRQEASRFASKSEKPRSDGAVPLTGPSTGNDGNTRTQAALLVTGRRSFNTLERIGEIQRVANDEGASQAVRVRATAELEAVDRGAPVLPAVRRVGAQLAIAELEALADSLNHPAGVRRAAAGAVARIRSIEDSTRSEDLEQLARAALERAKSASTHSNRVGHGPSADIRRFVFTWTDLSEWWMRYDCDTIADGLTEDEWAQFEATLVGTVDFAERVRTRRALISSMAPRAS